MYFRSQRKSAGDVSLSDSIDAEGEGNSLSLMDVICAEDDVFERLSSLEIYRQLRGYVETALDEREREIITVRYGLSGKKRMTQRETAENLGISRSYVSRIEKKALEKLRRCLEADEKV